MVPFGTIRNPKLSLDIWVSNVIAKVSAFSLQENQPVARPFYRPM